MKHGLTREEWERRFARTIEVRGNVAGHTLTAVVNAELESWPASEDDWEVVEPEDAAAENLSYWDDDEAEAA